MPPDDILTDDYVAELLAKEATDCSLKYSAMGLDAYKSSKRPANQPKPNTRFLNNIIRDTNSHNRALLAKENAESQARLRELEEAERRKQREDERKSRRGKPGPSDTRKRMLGDIAAHLGGPFKRRKTESTESSSASKASDWKAWAESHNSGSDPRSDASRKATDAKPRSSSSKKLFAESGDSRRDGRRLEKSRGPSRRDRAADDDGRDDQNDLSGKIEAVRRHAHRRKSRDDGGGRRRSPDREERKSERHRSPKRRSVRSTDHESKRNKRNRSPSEPPQDDSDSDPLGDIIGPPPPAPEPAVRRRGRGANAGTSGIDSRFAADYDPRLDVTPEPDDHRSHQHNSNDGDEDWDNAVEAFRDRLKWRQQGAERLRSAGFTEDEIRKWEKGGSGGEKDESDVRWTERGGLREWDRGKVVDDDGQVKVEAKWGRLKGT